MRKILFGLVLLVAVLLVLEVGVTLLSQKGMERALRSQYGLPSSLEVSINSFPFLVSLARNHLGQLDLSWDGELECMVEAGMSVPVAYSARASLYDVELSMPYLLGGKLAIKNISRVKANISLIEEAINDIFLYLRQTYTIEDDRIFLVEDGSKIQYKVKVAGIDEISFEPLPGYTANENQDLNPNPKVKTIKMHSLPMDARLQSASVSGGKVKIEISIPDWEGYLGNLNYLLI